jgi:hypothetical protein
MQRDNKQQCSTTTTKAGRQQGKVQAIFMRQQTQTAGNGRSMAAMQQASNIHARLQQGASSKRATSRLQQAEARNNIHAERLRDRGSTQQWQRERERQHTPVPATAAAQMQPPTAASQMTGPPSRCRMPEVFSIHDTTDAKNYWAGWA